MKIHTLDELTNKLDEELAWRKKELSAFKYYIDKPQTGSRRDVLSRCGIVILYAHWEGFVKLASKYFLEFLSTKRLRNEQLKNNLLTLSLYHSVNFSSESRKYSEYGKVTNFFIENFSDRAILPHRTGLDTKSNLSSTVLKEILWCLGIDYSWYETKEKFIDSRLLDRRNHIAHGKELYVDIKEFEEMRSIVTEMMAKLKTELENSAVTESYIKVAPE